MPRWTGVSTLALVLVVCASPPLRAQAALTFSEVETAHSQGFAEYVFGDYRLASSSVTDAAFVSIGTVAPNFAGSSGLLNNAGGATTTLTRVGNAPFDVFSIALAHVFTAKLDAFQVDFVGVLADGGAVFQSFIVPELVTRVPVFTTFDFSPGFRNLASLSWQQAHPYHQFDDVVLERPGTAEPAPIVPTVAPEPISALLLGTGLAGLGALRRRRRRSR